MDVNRQVFKFFPTVNIWLSEKRQEQKNEDAIQQTLEICLRKKPKLPWPYCNKVLSILNGNYNEREAVKEHEDLKTAPVPDAVLELIKKIGG